MNWFHANLLDMNLIFEITEGDRAGTQFEIRDGLTLGRKRADIVLRDSKVSSIHAKVEERDDGLYLVDQKSSNGLKIDGNKVPEVHLLPGVEVQIGKTFLLVIDGDDKRLVKPTALTAAWNEVLTALVPFVERTLRDPKRQSTPPRPFEIPVELRFSQGPQAGESWTLGFGPRRIGRASLDLKIDEPEAPNICFELRPGADGPLFRTEHPESVLLNGQGKNVGTLADGDVIEIFDTRIEIRLPRE
jgi:pSer/pThr/pTyr-binding forkhead associated (FHA) protein